jgi:hypothetical protein
LALRGAWMEMGKETTLAGRGRAGTGAELREQGIFE